MVDLVYHYTSGEGVHGIINTEKVPNIRFTDIDFLNDSQELVHGKERILTQLKTVQNSFKQPMGLVRKLEAELETAMKNHSFYTASFCNKGDKLRQWLAYCPNGGYSIGFDKAQLIDHFKSFGHKLSEDSSVAASIEYDRVALAGKALHIMRSKSREKEDYLSILRDSLFYKDDNFSDEEEFRVLLPDCRTNEPLIEGWHVKNNIIIPYINEPLPISMVKEIYISPMHDQALAQKSLEKIKKARGYNFEITLSEISLRPSW